MERQGFITRRVAVTKVDLVQKIVIMPRKAMWSRKLQDKEVRFMSDQK
jgi:hypothetical protein